VAAAAETWETVDTVHRGETVTVHGNGFSGIGRLTLLHILHRRCQQLEVDLRFRAEVTDLGCLDPCDLLIGADGAGSLVRHVYADFFLPSIEIRQNRYVWLGTGQRFSGLTMIFRESPAGLFIAHAYRYRDTASTFIVECGPETWTRSGFGTMTESETCRQLGEVFAHDLGGHPLLANRYL